MVDMLPRLSFPGARLNSYRKVTLFARFIIVEPFTSSFMLLLGLTNDVKRGVSVPSSQVLKINIRAGEDCYIPPIDRFPFIVVGALVALVLSPPGALVDLLLPRLIDQAPIGILIACIQMVSTSNPPVCQGQRIK